MSKLITTISFILMLLSTRSQAQENRLIRNKIIDQFNYHLVRYSLVNGTAYQQEFDRNFLNYGNKYDIADTNYKRTVLSIPKGLPKTTALCEEIDILRHQLPSAISQANLPAYLVRQAYTAGGKQKKWPALFEAYLKWEQKDIAAFASFKDRPEQQLTQMAVSESPQITGDNSLNPFIKADNPSIFKRMTEWIITNAALVVAVLLFLILISRGTSIATVQKK